ncbi:MAG: hypothetical protein B6241_14325 [Spirochaetaceae bacterium 4572_59]|nr:MAG: hypothetical protein B6241_14325 [Spirochaetaceae bacterium 4572_59]
MNRDLLLREIEEKGTFSFARSGGPGGQNVNKVNTKVLLTIPLESLNCLNAHQKGMVRTKMGSRINAQDEFFIHMQQERSQLMNKQLALELLADLIMQSTKHVKARRKTRPTRGSVERRLSSKKKNASKKKSRGRFSDMD